MMNSVIGKIGKSVVAMVCATVLVAAAGLAADAHANELTVWINGDKGYDGLAKVGARFAAKTGVKVKVEHPQDATSKFQTAAASGKGPCVFFWAHDRAGEWVAGGLLSEIKPSTKLKNKLEKKGWDAWTVNGKFYGYPVAFEAVGLIYNKDLVKAPPKSWAEVFSMHKKLQKQGKRAVMWDIKNTYFTFGLLAAKGGYAFKRLANGNYDEGDVGVSNRGSLAGLELLVRLIKEGVIPKDSSYENMEAAMIKGEVAMIINGPWGWENLRKNKVDIGVAPLPTLKGSPSKPFVGVLGAMINQSCPEKDLAREFVENYVLTNEGLKDIDDDKPIGVPALKSFYRRVSSNRLLRATMLNVKNGVLMPHNPRMGKFWSAMNAALENAVQGRQTAKQALNAAYKRITAP